MYRIDVLVQGYPGKSVCHGGLGWSTIALLRSATRTVLVDVGAFSIRPELKRQLDARGVRAEDVTDILLTHAHWDHSVNYTLFPNATVWIGRTEMDWATKVPVGFNPLPELYVADLARSPRLRLLEHGREFLDGFTAHEAPGHTPGCLLFYLTANEVPVLFTGDAAKNRAELLSRAVDMTMDRQASEASLDAIWALWRKVPGTLLVPGHDLTMRLGADGRPEYVGQRRAGIKAWFDEDLAVTEEFDISAPKL
ncbi:MBL fold metallo-hydrolase [Caldovatus aquaticus]|uniref:MBL fold metallo-hydrolase n=1 Tax=Caldovatus aquaticus TaxID=2865671 RepID=A0ABS7F527_9PROT|nr:MBL fold metallo-hydrolase [Caldovatus aquaticus]MBW8270732.1 MBL fold metallo-hydrolase [Caldovatus aquaticus]